MTQLFDTINWKKSTKSDEALRVLRLPNMTSFERALVKATLMRRQSFSRSPI